MLYFEVCLRPVRPESGSYPTLAESDVPPPLPHRAEAAAAHAAQNLLVSISLHLSQRQEDRETERIFRIRKDKKRRGVLFSGATLNNRSRQRDNTSRHKRISHPDVSPGVSTSSSKRHTRRVTQAVTLPNAINKHVRMFIKNGRRKEGRGKREKRVRCCR